jgi:hypothetical protein
VPGDDEFNSRFPKRLDDVEILLAGHAENAVDALILQCCNQ